MKEFIIEENEAGQRFDKYLAKLLRAQTKVMVSRLPSLPVFRIL